MTNLTYNDYLNYLKVKFDSFQESQLLPEDFDVYKSIKETLSDASSLPKYVLEASLLDSIDLDEETLDAIDEIKRTISGKNDLTWNFRAFVIKTNEAVARIINSREFVAVVISFLLISVVALTFVWGSSTSDLPLEGTSVLSGSAGPGALSPSSSLVIGVLCVLLILLLVNYKD